MTTFAPGSPQWYAYWCGRFEVLLSAIAASDIVDERLLSRARRTLAEYFADEVRAA